MKDPNRRYRTRAALFRLNPIRTANKHLSLASKAQLMRAFILSTFLYACESVARTVVLERRIQALDMRCCQRLLYITCNDHVTVKEVRKEIQNAIEKHNDHLTIVKNRKVR